MPQLYCLQHKLLVLILLLVTNIHHSNATCSDGGGTDDCKAWAAAGECVHNPTYMFAHCALSCQSSCMCSNFAAPGFEADKNCFCAYWATIGHCDSNPTLRNTICQTSCSLVASIDCGNAPDVQYTDKTVPSTAWGGNATYQCSYGSDQTGGKQGLRYCDRTGSWKRLWYGEGVDPICELWVCPQPQAVAGAAVSVDNADLTFGTKATYTCDPNKEITAGDAIHTCGNRTWTGTLPTCEVFSCGQPPSVEGASSVSNGTMYGDTATYTCADSNAVITGEATLTCQTGKTWGTPPVCASMTLASPVIVYITIPLLVLLISGLLVLAYYLVIFNSNRRTFSPSNKIGNMTDSELSLVSK